MEVLKDISLRVVPLTKPDIDGKEAERIRLANKTVPDKQLMAETLTMAQKISENSTNQIASRVEFYE